MTRVRPSAAQLLERCADMRADRLASVYDYFDAGELRTVIIWALDRIAELEKALAEAGAKP